MSPADRCPAGLRQHPYDRKQCIDENECENDPCMEGTQCHNLPSGKGYFCICLDNEICFNCSCAGLVTELEVQEEEPTMVMSFDAIAVIVASVLTLLSKEKYFIFFIEKLK